MLWSLVYKRKFEKMQSVQEGDSAWCEATFDKNYSKIGFF
jgi:hypothetical protein